MLAAVDGDIVVFRCGFAAERTVWYLTVPEKDFEQAFEYKRDAMDKLDELLPGVMSRTEGEDFILRPERNLEPLSHALQNVKSLFKQVYEGAGVDEFTTKVFLSEGRNFRHDIAVTRPYKGNRRKEHRPTYETEIRNWIIENYDTEVADNEEADDLMGIFQTRIGPDDSIICTMDKDLDQVPGWKYNWYKDEKYYVTEEQANYNFVMQLMTGDSTDNIPGLPGIGPGKAAKALHGLETLEDQMEEVCRMYQIHSGKEDWKAYLVEQARLLWIRRKPGEMWDYDFDAFNDDAIWEVGELELEL